MAATPKLADTSKVAFTALSGGQPVELGHAIQSDKCLT
jgi:hypothetical protein